MALWQAFVGRMARREPGTALALVRIGVGLSLFFDLATTWTDGAARYVWFPPDAGGWHIPTGGYWVVAMLGGPTAATVRVLLAAAVGAVTALALGIGSQRAALVALIALEGIFSLYPSSGGGHDRVSTNALWLLVFARSDATLSVSCRARTGRWTSDEPVPAWPKDLLVYQLVLVYTATGLCKIGVEWWPSGGYSAVYYALQCPSYARWDAGALLGVAYPLTRLGTAVTVPWESTWSLVLVWTWLRATADRGGRLRALAQRVDLRLVYVGIGLVMHGTLFVIMNLGPFAQVTTSLYFALFSHDEYRRLWDRVTRAFPAGKAAH